MSRRFGATEKDLSMMMKTNPATAALFVLVPAMFASNMAIARWFDGRIPPMTLASMRWLIAGVILTIIIRKSWPGVAALRAQWPLLAVLTLLGGVLSVAPQYAAANYTQAGHIALIFATSPLMVSFIERLVWGKPLNAPVLTGSALAFSGIAVVVTAGRPDQLFSMTLNRGDLLALVAAAGWAGYTALSRRRETGLPSLVQLWVLALGSGIALIPFALIEMGAGHVAHLTGETVLGVVALATVAGVGAYCAFGVLIGRMGPSRAAMSMYLIPMWTLVFGAVFLGETLHAYHGVAIVLVMAGLAASNMRSEQHAPARA